MGGEGRVFWGCQGGCGRKKKFGWGGGWVGGGGGGRGQGGIEVFVKIPKKWVGEAGSGRGSGQGGDQGGCERRSGVFVKIKKKIGGGVGGQVRVLF